MDFKNSHFEVNINVYEKEMPHTPLKSFLKEIIGNFSIIGPVGKYFNIHIKLEDFDKFYERFYNRKGYLNWQFVFQEDNGIWTKERLIKHADKFKITDNSAWRMLCKRKDIKWKYDLISALKDFLDFDTLSSNPSVEWTLELISQYHDFWNWEKLSSNPSLLWNEKLLETFSNKWIWKPIHNYLGTVKNRASCISTNVAIPWTITLFEKYVDLLDPWLFAGNGKYTDEIIINYSHLFEVSHTVGFRHYRYSDNRSSEEVIESAFEQFPHNENFFLNQTLIRYSKNKLINVRHNSKSYHEDISYRDEILFDVWVTILNSKKYSEV